MNALIFKGLHKMRKLTSEQLNDPNFFNKPEFDAEKKASYNRAMDLVNSIVVQNKVKKIIRERKRK